MEGMTLEKLQVIIKAQAKEYYDELNKIKQKTKEATGEVDKQTSLIKSAFSKIGKVVGISLSVAALVGFGKSCIELASDLNEVQNVVDVTFGNMSGTIDKFSKQAITKYGLSETAAKKYASTTGSMLKSMGFTTGAATNMSMAITGLTGDMASFYNLDADAAFEKVRSGISGETEPLKQLGINLSQANLQAYALSQGITKSYTSMSQQEQTLLRYNYLMKVTADAQGDFARTSGGWANQVRILSMQFASLKASIGQGLITVFLPVITVLNAVLAKIKTVFDAISLLFSKLTGKGASSMVISGAGSPIGGVAADAGSATGAMDSLGKSTGAAGKAAKKAKEAYSGLLSIDEINALTKNEDSSDGSGGSGGGSGAGGTGPAVSEEASAAAEGLGTVNPVLDAIASKLRDLKDLFKKGFWDGLGDLSVFDSIKSEVASIIGSLKDIFTDPGVVAAASNFVNTFVYNLGRIAGSLVSIGASWADYILGGWANYLANNKDWIKQRIIDCFNIGSDLMTLFGDFFSSLATIFEAFRSTAAKEFKGGVIGTVMNALLGAGQTFLQVVYDILDVVMTPIINNAQKIKQWIESVFQVLAPVAQGASAGVKEFFDTLKEFHDTVLKPLLDTAKQILSDVLGKVLDKLIAFNQMLAKHKDVLEQIGKVIGYVVGALAAAAAVIGAVMAAGSVISGIITAIHAVAGAIPAIGGAIAALANPVGLVIVIIGAVIAAIVLLYKNWDTVSAFFINTWDTIVGAVSSALTAIAGFFTSIWDGIVAFVQEVWNAIYQAIVVPVMDIYNAIVTAFEAIAAFFTGFWDGIVSFFRTIWDAFVIITTVYCTLVYMAFTTIWNGIKTFFTGFWNGIVAFVTPILDTIYTIITTAFTAIQTVFTTIWTGIQVFFTGFWNGIVAFVSPILDTIYNIILTVFTAIQTTISTVWEAILAFLMPIFESIYTTVVTIFTAIATFFQEVWDGIVLVFTTVWDTIVSLIQMYLDTVSLVWTTVWTAIQTVFTTIWNGLVLVITTVLNTIKLGITTALTAINLVWTTVWTALKTTVTEIFNGIWSVIKGVINSIIGGIEHMANAVVDGVNTVIRALNGLSFKVPDWVPDLGGETFGFNIPTLSGVSLPRLAKGGIVDSATLAVLGESGSEAVMPLQNNTGWISDLAAMISDLLTVNIRAILDDENGEMQTIRTSIYLDGDVIAEKVDEVQKRKGYPLVPND